MASYTYPFSQRFIEWADLLDPESKTSSLKLRLAKEIDGCPDLSFDHLEIGYTGRSTVAVFVTKGKQSCVLYDKTRNFPSASLMASLILLGSP